MNQNNVIFLEFKINRTDPLIKKSLKLINLTLDIFKFIENTI